MYPKLWTSLLVAVHDDIENTFIMDEFLLDTTESEEKLQNIDSVQQNFREKSSKLCQPTLTRNLQEIQN